MTNPFNHLPQNQSNMAQISPIADNWCISDVKNERTSFIWTINKFSKRPEKTGESFESSTFGAHTDVETKWVLSLYPNGEIGFKNLLSFGLRLKAWNSTLSQFFTDFKVSLIDGNQQIRYSKGNQMSIKLFVDI